jgi:hypothetical protein
MNSGARMIYAWSCPHSNVVQHGDPTKRNCYGTPFFAAFLSVACSLLRTLKAAEGETELARITATESQIITFSTDSNAGTASL